ncbi:MAG TPA: hypothetical protein VKU19_09010 [Bryobacteraceae bacterium]|nr:hypothetical protein [Bryobacteraceae bacterium]
MFQQNGRMAFAGCAGILALTSFFATNALAQYGGTGSSGATMGSQAVFNRNYHAGFDRPEAWGMKYFASSSLLSGLTPPVSSEDHHFGSISIGIESDWLPSLDTGQRTIGFNGTAPEDLNKAPIFARAVVRIGLPDKFTAIVAAPPPFHVFGVTSHLVAFGLERPIVERDRWSFTWRGYGQLGTVKGAFTCPDSALAFAPGSAGNPARCVGPSADEATLRYVGNEFQFAYRIPKMPKVVPHAAVGGNFIAGAFQVHAPVTAGLDQTHLWTHGGTFSSSAGVSYLFSKQVSFTVDAFYSPLWVQRTPGGPDTNDGLFNVRALLNYTFR